MTIKTKLTLNIIVVLLIVGTVVVTSIFGMRFISGKLAYLTSKSTPYQIRTLEFQREIQTATAALAKVNAAATSKELQEFRGEAEAVLKEVHQSQEGLEALSGGSRLETYDELSRVAQELFEITALKLQARDAAEKASAALIAQMSDSTAKLRRLDAKIRTLQGNRTGAFSSALNESGKMSNRLRGVEAARLSLKDLQLAFYELQHAQKRPTLLIARGKVNAAITKLNQNEYLKNTKGSLADLAWLAEHLEGYQKLAGAALSQKDDDLKGKIDLQNKEIAEKMNTLFLAVEQDALMASERFSAESVKQGTMFGQSNQANTILIGNSELVSLGMAIEAAAVHLFTLKSSQEIDGAAPQIKNSFGRAGVISRNLEQHLVKMGVREEAGMLKSASASLAGIQGMLFAEQGIVATLKQRFDMEHKAVRASQTLREIVLKQAEKGKETVSTARGDQEKAIASVNKMVTTSITLLIFISIGAAVAGILLGIWVFRSVSSPLNQLIAVSNQVAGGDLTVVQIGKNNDEYGKVLTAMSRMVENLREMVGKIITSTGTVVSRSGNLAATATELEESSLNQTSQIEQSVTAMTQMTQTIQDVSQNSLNTSEAAGRMQKLALDGRLALDATSRELNSFAELVRTSVERVEALGERSVAVNDIVEMIKDIADQTNLLALNASIEAARAGDMGRGFAVVADSVRQLARRTTESADEIAVTIKGMQSEVESSVATMQQERTAIDTIVAHIETTQHSMSEIVANVEQVFEMVQTIATSTEQQSATSEDINRNMQTIYDITQRLSVTVEQIKESSDGFDRLAGELQQMVGWFKL